MKTQEGTVILFSGKTSSKWITGDEIKTEHGKYYIRQDDFQGYYWEQVDRDMLRICINGTRYDLKRIIKK